MRTASEGRIGIEEILQNLGEAGFTRQNRPGASVGPPRLPGCRRMRASRTSTAGPVNMAVVVVPAAQVLATVDDCIAKHVPGQSASSAPASVSATPEDAPSTTTLLEQVRGRVADGRTELHGSAQCPSVGRAQRYLRAGVSAGRQHRNVVAERRARADLLEQAQALQLGLSTFVSAGNKADVSGNDLFRTGPRIRTPR